MLTKDGLDGLVQETRFKKSGFLLGLGFCGCYYSTFGQHKESLCGYLITGLLGWCVNWFCVADHTMCDVILQLMFHTYKMRFREELYLPLPFSCFLLILEVCVFTRESSYCFQRVLAIAILSVRLSVCLSHGWISQKRCKLESPNLHFRLPGRL